MDCFVHPINGMSLGHDITDVTHSLSNGQVLLALLCKYEQELIYFRELDKKNNNNNKDENEEIDENEGVWNCSGNEKQDLKKVCQQKNELFYYYFVSSMTIYAFGFLLFLYYLSLF